MNKKLFLHIGAGKTGTSAIQSQLAINAEKLEEYNYYYPTSSSHNNAKEFKITSGNAVEFATLMKDKDTSEKKISTLMSKYFKAAKGKNIILSSEVLQHYKENNAKFFKKIANDAAYEVIIVYYIRAIADHMVSLYHQLIKRHNYTNDFSVMVKNQNNSFLSMIKFSQNIFGENNLIIKNYDIVKKDIFIDFLENVLDIKDSKNFEISNKRVNRSLTSFEIKLMKHMNKFFDKNVESSFISNALIHNNPNKKYQMTIDVKDLEIIKSKFSQDIKEINTWLSDNEKPLEIINDLQIIDNEKRDSLNPFQESVAVILAELTKEVKKDT